LGLEGLGCTNDFPSIRDDLLGKAPAALPETSVLIAGNPNASRLCSKQYVSDLSKNCTENEGAIMSWSENNRQLILRMLGVILLGAIIGCAGGPLSTREKGAGIGALGGAAAGGIIGAAVGHPAAGAAIGGGLGLGAGALIGDQLQGQENRQQEQDQQIRSNQNELDRQRQELERLRRRQGEY
jgi:outer membrane lipoprotein SlyB